MTLKDLLKKKEKIKVDQGESQAAPSNLLSPDVPEFTFLRTTTNTESIIEPPSFPGDPTRQQPLLSPTEPHKRFGKLRRHSNAGQNGAETEAKGEHRLSERLHFGRQRSSTSVNVPDDLPDVGDAVVARNDEDEAKWEKRATMLARGNSVIRSGHNTPTIEVHNPMEGNRKRSVTIGKPVDDVCQLLPRGFRVETEARNRTTSRRQYDCMNQAVSADQKLAVTFLMTCIQTLKLPQRCSKSWQIPMVRITL
jgi:hypothetical protein